MYALFLPAQGAGDAEVAQPHLTLERHEHVGRGHVAVDDAQRLSGRVALAVGVVEAAQHLAHDEDRELRREPDLGLAQRAEQLVEVEPLHVLHGDEQPVALATEVEHLHDVGVSEPRRQLGLGHQHLLEGAVARKLGQDLFDHAQARAAQARVGAGEEDVGHASAADAVEQHIAAEDPGKRPWAFTRSGPGGGLRGHRRQYLPRGPPRGQVRPRAGARNGWPIRP